MLECIFRSFFKLPFANLGGYYNNYRTAVPPPPLIHTPLRVLPNERSIYDQNLYSLVPDGEIR
jgi:hypothetical protein